MADSASSTQQDQSTEEIYEPSRSQADFNSMFEQMFSGGSSSVDLTRDWARVAFKSAYASLETARELTDMHLLALGRKEIVREAVAQAIPIVVQQIKSDPNLLRQISQQVGKSSSR